MAKPIPRILPCISQLPSGPQGGAQFVIYRKEQNPWLIEIGVAVIVTGNTFAVNWQLHPANYCLSRQIPSDRLDFHKRVLR